MLAKGSKRRRDDMDLRGLDSASTYKPDDIATPDLALVDAARNGDNGAFAALYRRHYGAMLAFAWQYSKSKEQAEDLASEAFASVLDAIRQGKGPNAAVRAYMLTTVRNAAMKTSRMQSANVLVGDFEHLVLPVEEPDPVETQFENDVIARSFARLPERWQQVVWYLDVEQSTPAITGAILGMRPNAVSALAKRARNGLRKAYSQEHAANISTPECRPFASRLAEFAQGGLGRTQRQEVDHHLESCATCRAAYAEILDLQHRIGLSVPLGIAVAGGFAIVTSIVIKDLAMPTATWAAALSATGAAGAASGGSGASAGSSTGGGIFSGVGSIATIAAVSTVLVGGIAAAIGITVANNNDHADRVSAAANSQAAQSNQAAQPNQPVPVTPKPSSVPNGALKVIPVVATSVQPTPVISPSPVQDEDPTTAAPAPAALGPIVSPSAVPSEGMPTVTTPTGPISPDGPGTPTGPTNPTDPVDPVTPTDPVDPVTPIDPVGPVTPTDPVGPVTPTDPVGPVTPTDPVDPVTPTPLPTAPQTIGGALDGTPIEIPALVKATPSDQVAVKIGLSLPKQLSATTSSRSRSAGSIDISKVVSRNGVLENLSNCAVESIDVDAREATVSCQFIDPTKPAAIRLSKLSYSEKFVLKALGLDKVEISTVKVERQ